MSTMEPHFPEITSPESAPDAVQGSPIVYTGTATGPGLHGLAWDIESDAGTGVQINSATGVMSGGEGAAVGTHMICLACATVFGPDRMCVAWEVLAP